MCNMSGGKFPMQHYIFWQKTWWQIVIFFIVLITFHFLNILTLAGWSSRRTFWSKIKCRTLGENDVSTIAIVFLRECQTFYVLYILYRPSNDVLLKFERGKEIIKTQELFRHIQEWERLLTLFVSGVAYTNTNFEMTNALKIRLLRTKAVWLLFPSYTCASSNAHS